MAWPMNTRLRQTPLPSQVSTATTGQTLAFDIPKTGILSALSLAITGTVTGTPSTPNALGKSNLISRVRLVANAGITLIDVTGPGYHYLVRDMLETLVDPVPQSDGRSAVASGAIDLSMYFPIALNSRDPIGLINLQNEDTQLRLEVEIGALSAIANDLTALTLTVRPDMDLYTMPVDPKDWPPFDFAHTITEESQTVSGAGDVTYFWPRGNIYAQLVHGMGIGAAGTDAWTQARVRVNQTDYLFDQNPASAIRMFSRYRGRTKVAGVIPFDFLSWSGLGDYGSGRDLLDSRQLTDISTIVAASGAGTLRSMKRQLVPLRRA
jgi:hypothetical protein